MSRWDARAWDRHLTLTAFSYASEGDWNVYELSNERLLFLNIRTAQEIEPHLTKEQVRQVMWGKLPLTELDFLNFLARENP